MSSQTNHQRNLSKDSISSTSSTSKNWWNKTQNFFTKNKQTHQVNKSQEIYELPKIPPILKLNSECQLKLLSYLTVSEVLRLRSSSRELKRWTEREEVWCNWLKLVKEPLADTSSELQLSELYTGHSYELSQFSFNKPNRYLSLFKTPNKWEEGGDEYDNYEIPLNKLMELEKILNVNWNNETPELRLYLKSLKLHLKMELVKLMEVSYNNGDNYGVKRCLLIQQKFNFNKEFWNFIELNSIWINWSFTPPEYKLYRQLDNLMEYINEFILYYQEKLVESLTYHNELNLESEVLLKAVNHELIEIFLNTCIIHYLKLIVINLNDHLLNPPEHHPFPIPISAMTDLIDRLFKRYFEILTYCKALEFPLNPTRLDEIFIRNWISLIQWQCLYEAQSHKILLTQSINNWVQTQLNPLNPKVSANNQSNFWLFGNLQKPKLTLPIIPKGLFQFPSIGGQGRGGHQQISQNDVNIDMEETIFDLDTELTKYDGDNLIDWDMPSPNTQSMQRHSSMAVSRHEQVSLMDMDFDPLPQSPSQNTLIDLGTPTSTPMNKQAKSSQSGQSDNSQAGDNSEIFCDFPKFISIQLSDEIFTSTLQAIQRLSVTDKLELKPDSRDILVKTVEKLIIQFFQFLGEKYLYNSLDLAYKSLKPLLSQLTELTPLSKKVVSNYFTLMGKVDQVSGKVEAFFEEHLQNWIDFGDFIHPCNVNKKNFQTWLDDWVTNSLDEMIKVTMNQVVNILFKNQNKADFLPNGLDSLQPTKACVDCIDYLTSIFELLQQSFPDSKTLQVIKDEIMTRLFTLLCDHIKKFTINPHGGYRLLSDISAYHAFCSKFMHNSGENESLRQFDALKEIPNLFLIDDPVALKGLVQEENRYMGVFFIPDLLEFLGCRTDIKQIRPMIEQEGCSIM